MASKAILVKEYMVDEDASATIASPVMELLHPFQSIMFQFAWDVGVVGKVTFFASIFPSPFKWESLVSCEEVSFDINNSNATESEIVSIPGLWLNAGFIRFEFVPSGSSTGNLSVAQRQSPT